MTADITYIITNFLRAATPDLDSRIGYQAEALRENKCTSELIGQLIDANDVKYLLSALALENEDFTEIFPEMTHLKKQERRRIIEVIEQHFNECQHCSLKRGYDFEIDARIKTVCLDNKDSLLQMLDDDTDSAEDGHLIDSAAQNEKEIAAKQKLSAHF